LLVFNRLLFTENTIPGLISILLIVVVKRLNVTAVKKELIGAIIPTQPLTLSLHLLPLVFLQS
jgi:hypothetical protein